MSENNDIQREKRKFRMHPEMLYSVIRSQAGSIQKAFLELVMNCIDAGATTVDIKLTGKTFSVLDDGKGFASRQEIDEFFETFGTPHKEGDARYGKFRMGRGQIMAFTKNSWRSGNFGMDVDVKNLGLDYDLVTLPEVFNGCLIKGEMYDPMPPSGVIGVIDALREMCKFTPIPVLVNDEQISVDVSKQKWTMEDDDAYYLLRPAASYLEVYNLGVHVRHYYQSELGLGGVVVSKKQLEVNFARNDVLTSQCQVWKRISKVLRANAKKDQERKPVQNEGYRTLSMKKILLANFESTSEYLEALGTSKIFTDVAGKHYSLAHLVTALSNFNNKLVAEDKENLKSKKVHEQKMALVLAPITLERASWASLDEVFKRILKNLKHHDDPAYARELRNASEMVQRVKDCISELSFVAGAISDNHFLVDEKDLTKEERAVLKTIRDHNVEFQTVVDALNADHDGRSYWEIRQDAISKCRDIKVCESDTVTGYTDGKTLIAIERKLLKIGGNPGDIFASFENLKNFMFHEYLYEADDSKGHEHPAEFFEKFHDVGHNQNAQKLAYEMVKSYIKNRGRAGLKIRSGDAFAMDILSTENDVEENVVSMKVAA